MDYPWITRSILGMHRLFFNQTIEKSHISRRKATTLVVIPRRPPQVRVMAPERPFDAGKTYENPWKTHGKPMDNHGKTMEKAMAYFDRDSCFFHEQQKVQMVIITSKHGSVHEIFQ